MPWLEQKGVHFGLAHQSEAISSPWHRMTCGSLHISEPSRTFLQDNWAEKTQQDHSQIGGSKVTDLKLQPGTSAARSAVFGAQQDDLALPECGNNVRQWH